MESERIQSGWDRGRIYRLTGNIHPEQPLPSIISIRVWLIVLARPLMSDSQRSNPSHRTLPVRAGNSWGMPAMPENEPQLKSHRKPGVETTVVSAADVRFGDGAFPVLAGPAAVESEEQIMATAFAVSEAGGRSCAMPGADWRWGRAAISGRITC